MSRIYLWLFTQKKKTAPLRFASLRIPYLLSKYTKNYRREKERVWEKEVRIPSVACASYIIIWQVF